MPYGADANRSRGIHTGEIELPTAVALTTAIPVEDGDMDGIPGYSRNYSNHVNPHAQPILVDAELVEDGKIDLCHRFQRRWSKKRIFMVGVFVIAAVVAATVLVDEVQDANADDETAIDLDDLNNFNDNNVTMPSLEPTAVPSVSSMPTTVAGRRMRALGDFYDKTNGLFWKDNTRWMTDTDYCTWHGILCADNQQNSTFSSAIDRLNLRNNGIVGNITVFGTFLSRLGSELEPIQMIALDMNEGIVGSVPDSLCNVVNSLYVDTDVFCSCCEEGDPPVSSPTKAPVQKPTKEPSDHHES